MAAPQPCEVCGDHVEYEEGDGFEGDEFEEDQYRIAVPGNRAHREGFRFRRICGRCRSERPDAVAAVVEREQAQPFPPS